MNVKFVKLHMVERDIKAIDLSRQLNIPYDRLIRVLGGFRKTTRAEAQAIADALGLSVEQMGLRLLPEKDPGSEAA